MLVKVDCQLYCPDSAWLVRSSKGVLFSLMLELPISVVVRVSTTALCKMYVSAARAAILPIKRWVESLGLLRLTLCRFIAFSPALLSP